MVHPEGPKFWKPNISEATTPMLAKLSNFMCEGKILGVTKNWNDSIC